MCSIAVCNTKWCLHWYSIGLGILRAPCLFFLRFLFVTYIPENVVFAVCTWAFAMSKMFVERLARKLDIVSSAAEVGVHLNVYL